MTYLRDVRRRHDDYSLGIHAVGCFCVLCGCAAHGVCSSRVVGPSPPLTRPVSSTRIGTDLCAGVVIRERAPWISTAVFRGGKACSMAGQADRGTFEWAGRSRLSMKRDKSAAPHELCVCSLLDAEEALVGLVTSLSHSQKKQSTSDMVTQRFKVGCIF